MPRTVLDQGRGHTVRVVLRDEPPFDERARAEYESDLNGGSTSCARSTVTGLRQ